MSLIRAAVRARSKTRTSLMAPGKKSLGAPSYFARPITKGPVAAVRLASSIAASCTPST